MTDRRAGGVGVNVDLAVNPQRRAGSVGVQVEYVPSEGGPIPLTVSATQAQSVGLAGSYAIARTVTQTHAVALRRAFQWTRTLSQPQTVALGVFRGIELSVSATQGQALVLGQAVSLARRITQDTSVSLAGATGMLLAVAQATQARLRRHAGLMRATTQAQSATLGVFRGYQLVVSTTQSMTTRLVRLLRLTRATTGNRRVKAVVTIAPALSRSLRITRPTSVRLVRQIQLTRTVTQAQSAGLAGGAGVPVSLVVVAAIQTRSLALERALSLVRGIAQTTAVTLGRTGAFERTLVQPMSAQRTLAVDLTRSTLVGTRATLDVADVTPFYEVLVSTTVAQALSLGMTGTGQSARGFRVGDRHADFVVAGRSATFAARRRGVRFTVEVR